MCLHTKKTKLNMNDTMTLHTTLRLTYAQYKKHKYMVSKSVILGVQSLRSVESQHFRNMLRYLNPCVHNISGEYVRKYLDILYDDVKSIVFDTLNKHQFCSIIQYGAMDLYNVSNVQHRSKRI